MASKPHTIKINQNQFKGYNELFEELQATNIARGLRQGTLDFYKSYQKIHKAYVLDILKLQGNDFSVSVYNDALIVSLINYMKAKGVKDGAINTHMRYVSTITRFAVARGYLAKPLKILKVKQDREVGQTYTEFELQMILTKPKMEKTDFVTYRNWVLVCFFLSTGARLSSVASILIRDFNSVKKTVKLSHTKNRQGQVLPITAKLVGILNEYLQIRKGMPDDSLFCDYTGNPLTIHAIQQGVEQHNRSRGVKKSSIHAFRRTFATQAIKLGMSAFELQALLGHSTMEMTSRYVKAAELDLPTSITRFNPLEQYELSREKSIYIQK
jgi:integrase/recombinase XerD